jgi:hypothetical protein
VPFKAHGGSGTELSYPEVSKFCNLLVQICTFIEDVLTGKEALRTNQCQPSRDVRPPNSETLQYESYQQALVRIQQILSDSYQHTRLFLHFSGAKAYTK